MGFHVGQKVVCVDDEAFNVPGLSNDLHGLKRGRFYTVRDVVLFDHFLLGLHLCLKLREIIRPLESNDEDGVVFLEFPYFASRFRPVTERNTDISVFAQMLTGAPNELERVDE